MCKVIIFQLRNVMSTAIKCIKLIKSKSLNSRLFKKLQEDLNADYHNLISDCDVRWMKRSDIFVCYETKSVNS